MMMEMFTYVRILINPYLFDRFLKYPNIKISVDECHAAATGRLTLLEFKSEIVFKLFKRVTF